MLKHKKKILIKSDIHSNYIPEFIDIYFYFLFDNKVIDLDYVSIISLIL